MGAALTSRTPANTRHARDLRIGNCVFFDEHVTLAAVAHGTSLRLVLHESHLDASLILSNFGTLQQLDLAEFIWSSHNTPALAPVERMQNLQQTCVYSFA
jgi:hypothetical protein